MAETDTATGAQEQEEQEKDPFAGFETEAFSQGEPIEEKPAERPATPAEKPAAETPAAQDEGDGDGDGEGAGAGDGDGTASKKQTAQERINELTRARRQAEREAADLRKRLEALEERTAPKEEPPKKDDAPPAKKDEPKGPPKPEDYDFGELDSAYIRDVVNYQTDLRLADFRKQQQEEQEQAAQTQRQRAAQERFQQQIEQGKQKYADFEEVVVQGAQAGTWPLSETLGQLLIESEVGEDVAYHLASNPDEAASVDRLAPVEQARYFGRLEAKFSAARAAASGGDAPAEKPATTRASQAPPPVLPAKGAGGRFQTTAATDDFAAFEAMANKG